MRSAAFALALAAFGIASASAEQRSCAPNCGSDGGWTSQRLGDTTYYHGEGAHRGWSGTEQQIGNTLYLHFTGPNGERRDCTTQRFGNQAYTNCD